MTDINQKIFTRMSAKNKLAMVNTLTDDELLRISKQTVLRIIKEVGKGKKGSKYKSLQLQADKAGNDRNAWVKELSIGKEDIILFIYIQYDNTDGDYTEYYNNFFSQGEYRYHFVEDDEYGNPQTYYFRFWKYDKAKVVKEILLQYLRIKYADKL